MASIDRYRPPREGYQPPSLPPKPPERHSKSPSRRRDVPPAVPSPPTHTSRTSPPRPASRRSAPSPAQPSPTSVSKPRQSQWYYTPEEALSSPSIIDGLSPAEERLRRAKGVNFIYQVGVLLDLPQITFWVAGVFFHRFYMRFSMVEEKQGIHHYVRCLHPFFFPQVPVERSANYGLTSVRPPPPPQGFLDPRKVPEWLLREQH